MKKSHKKGQAALEFLTTYGWAFIVILTAIGALAYFGFLKITPPSKCLVSPEFSCIDYQINYDGLGGDPEIFLVLSNSKDFTMEIKSATVIWPDSTLENVNLEINSLATFIDPGPPPGFKVGIYEFTGWAPGEKRYVRIWTDVGTLGLVQGEKAKILFTLTYTNEDITAGFDHTVSGEVIAQVN
ncbi:MAG: hypothetical protein KKG59_02890 [Nanoarchaeota archaeon]|nr:hypothetical protein [Nanoarchaeota archaeon]